MFHRHLFGYNYIQFNFLENKYKHMKTLKEDFFDNIGIGEESQIRDWLESHKIQNYTLNNDLNIDVDGNVRLNGYKEKQLPDYIKFRKVTGSFYIISCDELKSLEGCPKEVGGNFDCSDCPKLTSLKGAPKEVGGNFYCWGCGKQFTKNSVKKVNVKGTINTK